MDTDSEKKAFIEKALVAGLLILFMFTFVGSLKNMGMLSFGSSSRSVAVDSSDASDDQLNLDNISHSISDLDTAVTDDSVDSLFTKLERDPFQDFLPKEELPEPVKENVQVQESQPVKKSPLVVETQRKEPPVWNVSGVVWGGSNPQAIVNHKVMRIGDRLKGGAKILEINRDGITVSYQGESIVVAVISPGGKSKVTSWENRR